MAGAGERGKCSCLELIDCNPCMLELVVYNHREELIRVCQIGTYDSRSPQTKVVLKFAPL